MRRFSWHRQVAILAAVLSVAATLGVLKGLSVQAEEQAAGEPKVLALLPDDVLFATVAPKLSNIDLKAKAVADKLGLPIPTDLLDRMKSEMQMTEGLDESRSAALAFLAPANEESQQVILLIPGSPVMILPTSDYSKLISRLNPQDQGDGISEVTVAHESMLVGQKNDYAIFVGNEEGQKEVLKKLLARPEGMSSSIGSLADWTARQDVAFLVSEKGIKAFMTKAREGLGEMRKALERVENPQLKTARQSLEMYDKLFAAIDREVALFGAGARVDSDATIRVAAHADFVAGGSWAKIAKDLPKPSAAPLAGLPSMDYAFAMEAFLGGQSLDGLIDWSVSVMQAASSDESDTPLTEDELKQFSDGMKKSMQGIRSMSLVLGAPDPGRGIYSNMVGLIKVDDAETYLKNYAESIAAFSKFAEVSRNPLFGGKYEAKWIEVDGMKTLEMVSDMGSVFGQVDPNVAAQMEPVLEALFGPERKLSIYLATADKTTVAMAYVNQDNLKKTIDAAKESAGGLGSGEGVKTAAALLPEGSQVTTFISPQGFVHFGKTVAQAIMPGLPIQFPDFPETPPMALGVRGDASGADVEFVVPAETLGGFGQYIQNLR